MFSLAVTTALVLRDPMAQTVAGRMITSFLSSELDTEMVVKGVNINLFGNITLEGVRINDQKQDTLIRANSITVDPREISFQKKRLEINKIIVDNATFSLKKYEGDTVPNIRFLAEFLQREDTSKRENWLLVFNELEVRSSHFKLKNENFNIDRSGINFRDLDIENFETHIEHIIIDQDTVQANIKRLTGKEKSGFELLDFTADLKVSPLELRADSLKILTANSNLALNLKFSYDGFHDFNDFINNVRFNSSFSQTSLDLYDIGYFAPELFSMKNIIDFSGDVRGTVSNFKFKDFNFTYGLNTSFMGDVRMNGLPDIRETFVHLDLKDFRTTVHDIEGFRIPGEKGSVEIPDQLRRLGKVKIDGYFTGFYNDFVSYADYRTELGYISTDISFKNLNEEETIGYKGLLNTSDFNIGRLINATNYLGDVTMKAEVTGKGLTFETADLTIDGEVQSVDFRGNDFDQISVTGDLINKQFNGRLSVDDEDVKLTFNGIVDYSQAIPAFDFTANIDSARLFNLNLLTRDSVVMLSTNLNFNFMGDEIDNMQGIIRIDSTTYQEGDEIYTMDQFQLITTVDEAGYKVINVYSDFFDAYLEGTYLFADLEEAFLDFTDNYLDTVVSVADVEFEDLAEQNFIFNIQLQNTGELTRLFLPKLSMASNTTFSGSFNSISGNLEFEGQSDTLAYGNNKLIGWEISGKTGKKQVRLNTHANQFALSDTIGLDSITYSANIRRDTVTYSLNWNSDGRKLKNSGDIDGFVAFREPDNFFLKFNNADLYINDSLWKIDKNNFVEVDTSSIYFNEFGFAGNEQELLIHGTLSEKPEKKLKVGFTSFNVSNFDLLTQNINLDFDGIANGTIEIIDVYGAINLISDLEVVDFAFNHELLGDAEIRTNWENSKNRLHVDAGIIYTGEVGSNKVLAFDGYYKPDAAADNFDFEIVLNNYKVETIAPFLESFASEVSGLASGTLTMTGKKEEPELIGELQLMRTHIKLNYTNTAYNFADKLHFEKDGVIRFRDVTLYDSRGNSANMNGTIQHQNFADLVLDLNIETDRIAGLNTTRAQNDLYYGDGFASGIINISGPAQNVSIDISASTEKGTRVFFPISTTADVYENDYIVFINTGEEKEKEDQYEIDMQGVSLNFDLQVTPEADMQLFLPSQMGTIKASGSGLLEMDVNSRGEFSITGDYTVDRGSFYLTIRDMINRYFEIVSGGVISWNGDPYDADINMKGIYKMKTTLVGLVPDADSSSRVDVNCVIYLRDKLFNPDMKFSIQFPNLDEDQRQIAYTRLDTNDQAQMAQQMISLLVLNNFYYSAETVGSSGINSLAWFQNMLNNWLSEISDDFDIGIRYRPGDEITDEELEVALSTQLFNDRVSIDGNVGVLNNATTERTSNIVGDVNVEVKITRDGRFRVKAFNRANNLYQLYDYAPYTQGVGFFYRREFNRLTDIFRKKEDPLKKRRNGSLSIR